MKPQNKKYLTYGAIGIGALLLLTVAFVPALGGETNCFDGIDNDNDGQIDDIDDDCDSFPVITETLCADGIDNDGDGMVDHNDTDCTPASCPAWQHPESVGTGPPICVPDSPTFGITTAELGLTSNWQRYYNDGKWSVFITNPYYGQQEPPRGTAPSDVRYLIRWVGPDGLIFQDDVSSFGARGGTLDDTHLDRDDEIDLASGVPLGQWTVYVYMTTEDIGIKDVGGVHVADVQGRTLQSLGSTTFTVTETQNSIIRAFCLILPTC